MFVLELHTICKAKPVAEFLSNDLIYFIPQETLLPSDFIQEAGGDPNVDWMDALTLATSSHPTSLRNWLQRRGIVLGSRNGHAPPAHRSALLPQKNLIHTSPYSLSV